MTATEERLKALMMRGLAGDAVAHRQLLAELAGHLKTYFERRMSGAAFDAEDLVQETLIAIHQRRMSYDPVRPFTAWAYAIARYKLVDAYRRAQLRITAPLEEAEDVFAPDESEGATAKADVERLLGQLPDKQQQVIRYMKLQGLSVAEAAKESGLSESFVKVSVHRGMKKLMALMKGNSSDAD